MEKIDISPNLIWKVNYDKDVSKLQERASSFLSKWQVAHELFA